MRIMRFWLGPEQGSNLLGRSLPLGLNCENLPRFRGQKNGSRMGKIEFKKVKRMVWGHAEGAKGGLGVKRERVGLQIHTYSFRV